MKLFLDQCVPVDARDALRHLGHDVVHAEDLAMSTATDVQVLDAARDQDRTIVTFDSDFPMLLTTLGLANPSVIHVRSSVPHQQVVQAIHRVCQAASQDLLEGAVVSINSRGYRVRHLPIA